MTEATPSNRIFISYRRNDSAGYAGRLYDDLVDQFGEERVFRDIDTIEPGEDFVAVLDHTLRSVSVLLVVIGPRWVDMTDDKGRRRLDNPADFVRMEVARALASGVPVIPVLVEDARMPRPEQLPDDLRALTRRQYHEMSDSRWDYDIARLIESVKGPAHISRLVSRRAIIAAGGGAALFATGVLAVVLWPSDKDEPVDVSAASTDETSGNPSPDAGDADQPQQSTGIAAQPAPFVPLPPIANHVIPDAETSAWGDLGPRQVKGVVYHRTSGTALVDVDRYLRTEQPAGLLDLGVGHETGQIWMWNDPFGAAHPGVTPNRAPWANGLVQNPSGDAPQFIAVNGSDAVNRDLVSITITGDNDDDLSEECKRSVAWLTAYFADAAGIAWSDFPHVLEAGHMFVMLHNEFNRATACPGPAVTNAAADIDDRAQTLLRQYQTGT
ncbi:MAG: toll/interleukin-1 receptor domain-containing protein [Thermomicrobiales bacterium]